MKKFNIYKVLVVLSLILNIKTGTGQCNGSFTYTIGINGQMTFSSTATTSTSFTQFNWDIPGVTNTTVAAPVNTLSVQFPANNIYTITLTAIGPCTVVSTQTLYITTVSCNLATSFTTTPGTMGTVSFAATNTGTFAGTTYTYAYGDNTTVQGLPATHQYTSNGVYTATLTAYNNSTCTASAVQTFTVINACGAPPIAPSFTSTVNAAGNATFVSTSTGTTGSTMYTWQTYGPLPATTPTTIPGGINTPITTFNYTISGIYMVVLDIYNTASPTCTYNASSSITVNIPPVPCNIAAGFNYTPAGSGAINFSNTSTGTTSATTYTLYYGDGTTGTVFGPHTYASNGAFSATLTALNSATCISTQTLSININNACTAGYIYSNNGNGHITFTSTSSPSQSGDAYFWNFGTTTLTTSGLTTSVTYTANGTYNVSMQYTTGACVSSYMNLISVTGFTTICSLNTSFTHTVSAGGNAIFSGTSTASSANYTCYTWNFGDGSTATGTTVTHTYASSGAYPVKLVVFDPVGSCKDSTALYVNITGAACNANANFNLSPSDTAQVWSAIPAYPWNITSAAWNWGDNSSSSLLYTSHTYSAPGNYNICLTVTVFCGSTATACATYNIYKPAGTAAEAGMVKVNVINPGTSVSVKNIAGISDNSFEVYPNPNNGFFNIKPVDTGNGPMSVTIYSTDGSVVYTSATDSPGGEEQIDLQHLSGGIYFIKRSAANRSYIKKLVINK